MIAVNSRNATDIYLDEGILSEECKCQSVHRLPGGRMCSEEVVSLAVMSCEPARLICFNATLASLNWINAGGTCTCYNAAAECWSIRPV